MIIIYKYIFIYFILPIFYFDIKYCRFFFKCIILIQIVNPYFLTINLINIFEFNVVKNNHFFQSLSF